MNTLRPMPSCPGAGILNALALGNNTGPATPGASCKTTSGFAPTRSARDWCEKLEVKYPLRMLNGSPLMPVKMPFRLQPPMIWFRTPCAPLRNGLPLPTGSSYTLLTVRVLKRLKSESARSLRQVRVSAGVREFEVLSPPPDDEPTGSTDWSSIDFENVYATPN